MNKSLRMWVQDKEGYEKNAELVPKNKKGKTLSIYS